VIAAPKCSVRAGEGQLKAERRRLRMDCTWLTKMPAAELIARIKPFSIDIWSVGGVSPADVLRAQNEGRLSETNPHWDWQNGVVGTTQDHAERIAWLVTHGWDPDEPLLAVLECDGRFHLEDGNHRLHALAYLGSADDVLIQITGFRQVIEEVFGVSLHDAVG
jgi:hypothetical protein